MEDFNTLDELQTGSEMIYDGEVVHLYRDDIVLPDGKPAVREVIRHIGAVGIIPVTEDGRVVIERQFRYPLNMVITEIPAGKLDSKEEDRLEAAKRELREETGITADEWTDLGVYYPAAAYTDEKITIYMARGLHKGKRDLDDDEFINLQEIPLEELVKEVMSGKITDGKTQVGVLKAAMLLGIRSL